MSIRLLDLMHLLILLFFTFKHTTVDCVKLNWQELNFVDSSNLPQSIVPGSLTKISFCTTFKEQWFRSKSTLLKADIYLDLVSGDSFVSEGVEARWNLAVIPKGTRMELKYNVKEKAKHFQSRLHFPKLKAPINLFFPTRIAEKVSDKPSKIVCMNIKREIPMTISGTKFRFVLNCPKLKRAVVLDHWIPGTQQTDSQEGSSADVDENLFDNTKKSNPAQEEVKNEDVDDNEEDEEDEEESTTHNFSSNEGREDDSGLSEMETVTNYVYTDDKRLIDISLLGKRFIEYKLFERSTASFRISFFTMQTKHAFKLKFARLIRNGDSLRRKSTCSLKVFISANHPMFISELKENEYCVFSEHEQIKSSLQSHWEKLSKLDENDPRSLVYFDLHFSGAANVDINRALEKIEVEVSNLYDYISPETEPENDVAEKAKEFGYGSENEYKAFQAKQIFPVVKDNHLSDVFDLSLRHNKNGFFCIGNSARIARLHVKMKDIFDSDNFLDKSRIKEVCGRPVLLNLEIRIAHDKKFRTTFTVPFICLGTNPDDEAYGQFSLSCLPELDGGHNHNFVIKLKSPYSVNSEELDIKSAVIGTEKLMGHEVASSVNFVDYSDNRQAYPEGIPIFYDGNDHLLIKIPFSNFVNNQHHIFMRYKPLRFIYQIMKYGESSPTKTADILFKNENYHDNPPRLEKWIHKDVLNLPLNEVFYIRGYFHNKYQYSIHNPDPIQGMGSWFAKRTRITRDFAKVGQFGLSENMFGKPFYTPPLKVLTGHNRVISRKIGTNNCAYNYRYSFLANPVFEGTEYKPREDHALRVGNNGKLLVQVNEISVEELPAEFTVWMIWFHRDNNQEMRSEVHLEGAGRDRLFGNMKIQIGWKSMYFEVPTASLPGNMKYGWLEFTIADQLYHTRAFTIR